MAKISISMTDNMETFVQTRVKEGDYNNTSEYFRDLVRRDQEQKEKFAALRKAIQEGIDGGVSAASVDDIWAEAKTRFKAQNG